MNTDKDTRLESLIEEEGVNTEPLKEDSKKKKFKINWTLIVAILIALGMIGSIIYICVDTVNYLKSLDEAVPEAVVETTECTAAPVTETVIETGPEGETATEVVTEPVIDILPEPTESKPAEKKEPAVKETEPATESTTEPTTEQETVNPNGWAYDDSLTPEKNIFIYLTDYLGYSDAAACGIIANIAYETGWKFKPDVGDINHGAYGLIQWMGGRRKKLRSWCEETGRDWRTIQGQMDFMDWELKNDDPYGTYDRLLKCANSVKGAYKAGYYFCYWYERPNRIEKASEWRGGEAKKYYKSLVLGEE